MKDFLIVILSLLLLLSLPAFLLSWIAPNWTLSLVKNKVSKKSLRWILGLTPLIIPILIGFISDDSPSTQPTTVTEVQVESKPVEETATVVEVDAQPVEQKTLYSVVSVTDGDTLSVEIDGKKESLRLIGINTPETVDPRTPVECFGKEASNKAQELLNGKKVFLEADSTQSERDKYSRLLRYAFLEDGTNFNKLMIEEGYAYEYTYNTPYKYQAEFKQAETLAKENKKGLWAENTCNGELNKATEAKSTEAASPKTTNTAQDSGATGNSCSGKRTCGEMKSCSEARFYLNSCGVSGLDRDKDGVPCEDLCN